MDRETWPLIPYSFGKKSLVKWNGRMQGLSVDLKSRIPVPVKWFNPICRELMDTIKRIGKDLAETSPSETVIGNMTRRMLKIVRDEYAMLQKGKQEESDLQDSLQKILTADENDSDYTKNIPLLKPAIMEHIGEFLAELESRFNNLPHV